MTVRSSHNFIIGDLGFHKLLDNEQHVYERATAPFRKEQFDAAPTVGDQSLAGWWTRGQLSFHKGAGTRYYEVLDGDEILNTFLDGEDVDPWTPGKVTLASPWEELPLSNVRDIAYSHSLVTTPARELLCLMEDGTLRAVADGINFPIQSIRTPTTVSGASMTGVTSGRWYAFVCGGEVVERFRVSEASTTALKTVTGATVLRVWYAKGRLWFVDTAGRWYVRASDTVETIPTTDADFTIPDRGNLQHTADTWSLTETPGAVMITAGSNVYAVTVEDNGTSTPTIGAPVLAAMLPNDESISGSVFHLGHLALATNKGVRFAIVNNTQITYGPAVADDVDFSACKRLGAKSERVLAVGTSAEGSGLYGFNLAQQNSDLAPAYVREMTTDAPGTYTAVLVGKTYPWVTVSNSGSTNLLRQGLGGAVAETGSLSTGFHRFGTLEGKHFAGVKVRAAGTAGTIDVYLVQQDGSETLLGTVDVSVADGADVSLVTDAPSEAVGLRFVLNRSTTTEGPELLGYQLKALPSPVRQRLIRVPLMMFDVERGPTGRAVGKEKDAWSRLAALESLEETDALVDFEDKDTGETGTVYIESVELTQKNGSRGRSRANGFGGVVTLTLRKVA